MSKRHIIRLQSNVKLTPLMTEHAPNMARWMCDPQVANNLGLRSEPSLEKTLAWLAKAAQDSAIQPFAVLFRGQHVGNIVLDRIDTHLSTARLSVYIGESKNRASGIGTTALYLVLVEAFTKMDLHKTWLTVHSRNYLAINTYTKLGFRLEGILRDEFYFDGQRLDALYMGLLSTEFKQLAPEWSKENHR